MIMNTRREMALALLGLPLAAKVGAQEVQPGGATNQSTTVESESPINAVAKPATESPARKPPPPYSVAAVNIISYTLYAEARGESIDGKIAVASVIKTRSKLKKLSLVEVCLQNRQFSCWNDLVDVPEYYITGKGIQPDDLLARGECYGLAWVLMAGRQKWEHLTHFYNPDKATPDWAYDLRGVRTIGKHVFGYID